jgi:tRNA pseudouridine38-40 synthase
MERRFYAMRLWYDGARFKGYQRQPNLPSVQEALEGALARSGVRTSIAAAARTDAGVHALSQVVSFATRADLDPEWLRRSVNSALPDGIAVLEAFAVPKSFHARASARSRTYVYLVGVELPEPLRPYAWSLPDRRAFKDLALPSLDREALQAALTLALGDHDFTGFARPGGKPGKVHRLLRAEVHSASFAPLHALVLEGTGFVRAMVRNLVGAAVTAGVGLSPPVRVAEILEARARYRGVRAPAWGLTLARVSYPAGPDQLQPH